MKEHSCGAVPATHYRLPVRPAYYEACRSELQARKREVQLKTSFGRRYLKNRLRKGTGGQTAPGNASRSDAGGGSNPVSRTIRVISLRIYWSMNLRVRDNLVFSVESQGARALALDARQTLYGVFHEFSVHWTRSRSLLDGPRMRYQHIRICERGSNVACTTGASAASGT
jgi:hypothetical protein